MSKFLRVVLVCVMSLMTSMAYAQQLPDSGFEDWGGTQFDGKEQPKYWNFSNVEQLGVRDEDLDETVIENEIVHNVKNFIMTFGKGFTFSGCQVHYDKLGHDHWVDLLFFNRILRATVVVELKKGTFKPAYLGQLSHYLHVIDDDDRLEWENRRTSERRAKPAA